MCRRNIENDKIAVKDYHGIRRGTVKSNTNSDQINKMNEVDEMFGIDPMDPAA